ncbi:MAG TPA: cysteine desulfurase family protein [Burkholderiales bacterium]|nr:cysteine desulfurase family protein [Burkholderiales bacterium]
MIYLDNNATTRPAPEVVAAVTACLQDDWGNPSSKHGPGQAAKTRVAQARGEVARLLGARPAEVVFTSGATEANVWALRAAVARTPGRRRIVVSAVEHAGMLRAAQRLAREGVAVDIVPVDRTGRLDLDALERVLQPDTALLALMAANNETGVLLPVAEAAALAARRDVPMLVDATQAVGRVPVNFAEWGVDLLTCSAHKLHGPKGIGALVVRRGFELPPLIDGSQERGRRGGTENVPGIVGFGVAATLAHDTLDADAGRMAQLRDALEAGLRARLPAMRVHGESAPRLPNTTSLRLPGIEAEWLLDRLERAGICAASGSACSAGGTEPSHVLLAMGARRDEALETIRISLSRATTAAEIAHVVETLSALAGGWSRAA